MEIDSKYVKNERSQSASLTPSPHFLSRDHRHRSSLPNALLAPSLSQIQSRVSVVAGVSQQAAAAPARTSVISFGGTNGPTSISTFHRPLSSSSLATNLSPTRLETGVNNARRHSINTISNDVEMRSEIGNNGANLSVTGNVIGSHSIGAASGGQIGLLLRNEFNSRPGSTPLLSASNPRSSLSRCSLTNPDIRVGATSGNQQQLRNKADSMEQQLAVNLTQQAMISTREESVDSMAMDEQPLVNIFSGVCGEQSLQDFRSATASSASIASSASDESNTSDLTTSSLNHRRDSIDSQSAGNVNICPAFYGGNGTGSNNTGNLFNGSSCNGRPEIDQCFSPNGLSNSTAGGLSRQQLLSTPCPICGDRISGFHYGIFSCESCKGFFKRTVQNKKNYMCLRGANCPVTIATRKKCPACRFDRCLEMGMKLEAIREDRTRGGRSTYQCSSSSFGVSGTTNFGMISPSPSSIEINSPSISLFGIGQQCSPLNFKVKQEPQVGFQRDGDDADSQMSQSTLVGENDCANGPPNPKVPPLIREILSVEHLWHRDSRDSRNYRNNNNDDKSTEEMSDDIGGAGEDSGDASEIGISVGDVSNITDHRLYKLVKWCKSLPLFKEITMDDQVALLINSWCELLLLSCCYRSMSTPGQIRISSERCVSVEEAKILGISNVIERMVNLTEHLRRLKIDQYEYVCLKFIILLTSDATGLQEKHKVDVCQKQILEALQTYSSVNYPNHVSKFGEILLRIPELDRVCQVAKDSFATKQRDGDVKSFKILMELLKGDY